MRAKRKSSAHGGAFATLCPSRGSPRQALHTEPMVIRELREQPPLDLRQPVCNPFNCKVSAAKCHRASRCQVDDKIIASHGLHDLKASCDIKQTRENFALTME